MVCANYSSACSSKVPRFSHICGACLHCSPGQRKTFMLKVATNKAAAVQMVDRLDQGALPRQDFSNSYTSLYKLVQKALFRTHVEGQLKGDIIQDPASYVELDPDMAKTLLHQRQAVRSCFPFSIGFVSLASMCAFLLLPFCLTMHPNTKANHLTASHGLCVLSLLVIWSEDLCIHYSEVLYTFCLAFDCRRIG